MLHRLISRCSNVLACQCNAAINVTNYNSLYGPRSVADFQSNLYSMRRISSVANGLHFTHSTKLLTPWAIAMCVPARPLSSGDNTRMDSWSWAKMGKVLAALWTGTFLVIILIAGADMSVHEANPEEKRVKLEKESVLSVFTSIPCMKNTLLLAMVGGFTSWIITFLLTSSPKKAYRVGFSTPFLVGILFFVYCTVESSARRAEAKELANTLKDIQTKRAVPSPADEK